MSRINWSDDEERPGQFALWEANCERQMASRAGQAQLCEVRDALLALPEKRLIRDSLAKHGEVCVVGAWMAEKRMKSGADRARVLEELWALSRERDDYDNTDELAAKDGMLKLLAWSLVAENDEHYGSLTPEKRYEKVLAYVTARIK